MDLDALYLVNDILGTGIIVYVLTCLFIFILIKLLFMIIRQ